jgi:SAM-dependent methyltransferase
MEPLGGLRRNLHRLRHARTGLARGVTRRAPDEAAAGSSPKELSETSRRRWRDAMPTSGLTWGRPLSGDAFIAKAAGYGAFGPDRAVLEVGPGYGRLLRSALDLRTPFSGWCGIDISPANIEHLRRSFDDPRVSFVHGDIEELSVPGQFDVLVSSLTLKHLYPSFEAALASVVPRLSRGATLCFDLIESTLIDRALGKERYFVDDEIFLRRYRRQEICDILDTVGLQLVAFDTVVMDPEFPRLFVVARKPDGRSSP